MGRSVAPRARLGQVNVRWASCRGRRGSLCSPAMANLREQLLRAGLVDKKTKQVMDTQDRRAKKNRKKKRKKNRASADGDGTSASQAEARRRYEQQQAEQAEANRARETARREAQASKELDNRVKDLVSSSAIRQRQPGPRRFCFVTRDQKIRWIYVTAELAWRLERGTLAIVEQPGVGREPFAIVPDTAAKRLLQISLDAVRFWNRDGNPPAAP